MEQRVLYISDLDGTLLNSCKEVSDYTRNTLNSLIKNGVNFSIASARTAASVVKILEELNINLPVVLMNGVVVYDLDKRKYIKTEYIEVQAVEAVLRALAEFNTTGFMYTVREDNLVTYYENLDSPVMKEFHDERVRKYYKSFERIDSFSKKLIENEVVYFCLIDVYEKLTGIFEKLKSLPEIDCVLYRDIYAEKHWYLEIHSHKASKRNAVLFLRDYCKFTKIIGFGDNLNDVPLFEACDEGYAVANAVQELKVKANGVIGDNQSNAVARFIYEREASKK